MSSGIKTLTTVVPVKKVAAEEPGEDDELINELNDLVEKIMTGDPKIIANSLGWMGEMLKTATSSMTAVPKPLKYLAPHYEKLKQAYEKLKDLALKKEFADILSVLAITVSIDITKSPLECLKYCMMGTMSNVGSWGHEYLRRLESEIIEQTIRCPHTEAKIEKLLEDLVAHNCANHAEIEACDLALELDRLDLITKYVDERVYGRVCRYLMASGQYVDELEVARLTTCVADLYVKFGEWSRALVVAMQRRDEELAARVFRDCKDPFLVKQLAFMAARQLFPVELDEEMEDHDEIFNILNNTLLSANFQYLARELDILEPKSPEDVYKTWLEPTANTHMRLSVLTGGDTHMDSARQNLAGSLVNGFVNAGFARDKLMTGGEEGGVTTGESSGAGNRWIYRNKEHGMLAATASLGLIHLWDVDGGLTPIDKYLYSKEDMIKGGALLALGLVNCRVRNECDPALALLADFVPDSNRILRNAAIFGLGLAYISTNRTDVIALLQPAIDMAEDAEAFGMASLACGLASLGHCNGDVVTAIITKLVEWKDTDNLNSAHIFMALLGLGLCFMGHKEAVDAPVEALDIFDEPFNSVSKTILQMCAYAGTGDVCIIHEFLRNSGLKVEMTEKTKEDGTAETTSTTSDKKPHDKKSKSKFYWDPAYAQAISVIGLGIVALGEEIGSEMSHRLLGCIGSFADSVVKRVVPLTIALTSISKPHLPLIDLLIKYSHDSDDKVSCNAIFSLGLIGAGTNNARLASALRQLAVYHNRNSTELFMIRIAQGLVHMGKGTMTLSPLHTDRQLVDPCAIAGLLIPILALLDPPSLLLSAHPHLLYGLAAAMQPAMLLTLDSTSLQPVAVLVRVGQAVDVVARAGTPRTIAGIHTHRAPVLLAAGDRAELAGGGYTAVGSTLEGVCLVTRTGVVGEDDEECV